MVLTHLQVCFGILHRRCTSEGDGNLGCIPSNKASCICLQLREELTMCQLIQAQGSWQTERSPL